MRFLLVLSLFFLFLSGCASRTTDAPQSRPTDSFGRYSMQHDKAPVNPPDVSKVPDAVPRYEPHSRGGNRSPYEVFGQTYTVLPSAEGYRETGIASWYGMKFHGHLTSNGEVYDMYEMTAAHKSLPLPTFARVTNLDNGRSVIVRVNDRGPFHDDRLIDLSYAAAYRLDILQQGTGRVKVEAITPRPEAHMLASAGPVSQASSSVSPVSLRASHDRRYLQVGAFATEESARRAQQQVQSVANGLPVGIYTAAPSGSVVYRVKIGPLTVGEPLDQLIAGLANAGFHSPHLVSQP
ncbi:MAG: septal ring lytic transglycosylase RlpA family protein [Nitrincola lacisaponensis]|uniref:Endolytic peptidoglycan transglycosylase RlpA n=1 Tax=Nitrincola lacisaponensis TaxID=267850 RepID=A0A063Y6H4_9GAMM|nr:septal ring lytic transglycosylase RlpA family protein [Nitrincola lacisaponensis]KDE40371.1 Rare lipoprotein A precursor [Nitrincola lacisaponensis]